MTATERLRRQLQVLVDLGVKKQPLAKCCAVDQSGFGRWLRNEQNVRIGPDQLENLHAYLDELERAIGAVRATVGRPARAPSEEPPAKAKRARPA